MGGLPERLDKADSGKTVDLLALADGAYTLSLTPLRMGKESWVRALLTKGEGFFGLCLLCARKDFGELESLAVVIELRPEGASLRFSAQPEGRPLGAMEIPMDLAGECRLLPVAQTQGVTVTPLEPPPEPPAQQADATPVQPEQSAGPPPLRLHPGTYVLALLITALALAALALGNTHWRRITALALRVKTRAGILWAGLTPRSNAPKPSPRDDTRGRPRIPEGPRLPGLRVTDARDHSLIRQIIMHTAWETAAEPTVHDFPSQMNEYFLGRVALPAGGRFLTVGLRNRDALQQLGGGSVRPLFAPNPRGQIFSLEEETGGLYLHVDYFAPPSFVLQSVLRSVCLECVFALEDRQGNPLRLENVLGHSILGAAPAQTARTEAGFIVTEKGRLVVGEI